MATAEQTVDVDVDVRSVYNQWTQFEEFPRFMRDVESVTQRDDTHLHWVVNVAGVTREFDAEVTEQIPDRRIAWRAGDGVTHAGTVTFERIDDQHTRVKLQLDMEPEGLIEKAAEMTGIVSSRVKADMEQFKEFIESRHGHETGEWRGEVR